MQIMELDRKDQSIVIATAQLYCRVFAEDPWNEKWGTKESLEVVDNPLLRWWVMEDNNNIVAFVAGCVATPRKIATNFNIPREIMICEDGVMIGYKAELGVAPEFRRRGLAKQITQKLLIWFADEQISQFIVRTKVGTGNNSWYEKKLKKSFIYPDGRVVYETRGIPEL